jgi:hypothetical protein
VRTSVFFPHPGIVSDIALSSNGLPLCLGSHLHLVRILLRGPTSSPTQSHNSMQITLALMRRLMEYPAVVHHHALTAQEAETGQSAGRCSQRHHQSQKDKDKASEALSGSVSITNRPTSMEIPGPRKLTKPSKPQYCCVSHLTLISQ